MTGFLEEDPGVKSSMRLMNVISLVLAGIIAVIQVWKGVPIDLGLIGVFAGGAFVPKLIQKSFEGKE